MAWLGHRLSAAAQASFRRLIEELAIQRRHQRSVRRARALAGRRQLKLHLGSGGNYKDGWINVDFDAAADLQLDLRERFPFPDGSVAVIYSEHFFEHVGYPQEATHVLSESVRVLAPGGVFSVGVPDLEEVLLQYARGELPALLRQWADDPGLQWVAPVVWTSPMHCVNWCFRQDGEHQYAYDFETLAMVLREAGFTDVRRRAFDPSRDSADRRDGTLYVDAVKPA